MNDPALQRRRTTRLLIVGVLVLLLGGGLFALYKINSGQQETLTDEATIAQAREAFADAAYDQVVDLLESPRNNNTTLLAIKEDPELLSIYVTARQTIPLYNDQHLARIVTPLTQLIQLDPDDVEHGQTLLDTLLTLNRNDDALALGKKLITQHPDDTILLAHLALAQQRQGKIEESLATLQHSIRVKPLNVTAHAQMLDLINQYDLPTDPFIIQAERVYADHISDPQAMMIRSLAHDLEGNGVQARQLLKQASTVKPSNQAMVPLLTQWLDHVGLYAIATRYIMQHAEPGSGTPAGRIAIYRAFESDDYASILDRLKDSDPQKVNTDLLGMWASAHFQTGSPDQAKGLLKELELRDNAIASTWVKLIELDQQDQAQPAQTIDTIVAVLRSNEDPVIQSLARRHPYFMQRLGQAYLEALEPEAAFGALSVAANNSESWSRPHLYLTRTLLKLNQHSAALNQAKEAQAKNDSDASRLWLVLAMAASTDPSEPTLVNRVLEEADKLTQPSPAAEQALPPIVELLARGNRADQAKQRITQALSADNAAAETLVSLMRLSLTHDLGLDAEIAKQIESNYGITPGLALVKAQAKAETAGFEPGRKLLEDATPELATKPWQTAMAEYLATRQDARTAPLLVELAEQYPDDLALQLAALKANNPDDLGDRFGALIERLQSLAGQSTINWRLQQARVNMRGPADEQALKETAQQLRLAESFSPVHLELRIVLARCYMMLGDNQAAADRAQAAKSIASRNPQVMLLHGMALHRLNRYEESRLDLIPLATSPRIDPDTRRQACLMLNEQGESDTVQQAIEQMRSDGQANNHLLTILAGIYRDQGLIAKADQICEKLIQSPDAATTRFVSTYYHQTNRPNLAKKAILAAQAAGISEADRLMLLAEDAAQSLKVQTALDLIKQAAQLEADQPKRWHDATQLALSLAQPSQAIELAKRGIDALDGDRHLQALVKHGPLIQQIKDDASLIPMAVTILNQNAGHEQAVRVLEITGQQSDRVKAATALADLAQKHPDFKYLSELACDRLLRADQNEQALALAKSAMARFNGSGVAARVTTLSAYRLQDWATSLTAANAWAQRVPRDRMNADLMRAAALNKLARFANTIKTLRPYIAAQTQVSASNQLMYEYFTHALVRNGETTQAMQLLRPHLATSTHARTVALNRVSQDIAQADTAAAWLNELAPHSTSDTQERFALATATFLSGQRLNDESLIRKADQAITGLLQKPGPLGIDIRYAKGQIAQRLGNHQEAQASYRQVIAKVPDNPLVLNNLALVLVELGGSSLSEAEQLATKATQLSSQDPNLFDTLAIVHLRRGQFDQALKAIEHAIQLDNTNPAWRKTQADILEAMGEDDRAALVRQQYAPNLQN